MNSPDVRARLLNAADPSRSGTSWAAAFTAGIGRHPFLTLGNAKSIDILVKKKDVKPDADVIDGQQRLRNRALFFLRSHRRNRRDLLNHDPLSESFMVARDDGGDDRGCGCRRDERRY